MIRVLLVDDSPVALAVLKKILSAAPDIEVVGTAANGKDALELVIELRPNVICCDLDMPVMNGFDFIDAVMKRFPCPILVVSSLVQKEHTRNVFRALEMGALDILPKPRPGFDARDGAHAGQLIHKIRMLAGVNVHRKHGLPRSGLRAPGRKPDETTPVRIVVIGASTGGPLALQSILKALPADFPAPVLCVQHISEGFPQILVDWLGSSSSLEVKIAGEAEMPAGGAVYFPKEGRHLLIDSQGALVSSLAPPVNGHRPSVSMTFKSAAGFYGAATLAVLLTGMGGDGADGLKIVREIGGLTVAQDEESSIVFGMPKQAIELGAARYVLPLDKIAEFLVTSTCGERGARR